MSEIQQLYREDGSTDWAAMLVELMGREWVDALHKELFEGWMDEITNPMSPDCAAPSQHKPTSSIEENRADASTGSLEGQRKNDD